MEIVAVMALTKIIYVTPSQYTTLANGGTVGGTYASETGLDANAIYAIQDYSQQGSNRYRIDYAINLAPIVRHMVCDSYTSLKWTLQAGHVTGVAYNSTTVNLTFPVAFSNTNYLIIVSPTVDTSHNITGAWVTHKTTTGCVIHTGSNATSTITVAVDWIAIGTVSS